MTNILDLPDEILIQILGRLRVEDINSLRLTCKRLYYLSLDKAITIHDSLLLNERVFKPTGLQVAGTLLNSPRVFNRLVIKSDNEYIRSFFSEKILPNLISKFGEHFKEVLFVKPNDTFNKVFLHVIKECKNLEYLSFKDCNDMFSQQSFNFQDYKLLKVKSLRISQAHSLSDAILFGLFNLCPNLEKIYISSSEMNFHNGVYGRYYGWELAETVTPSSDVCTYKYFFFLLTRLHSIINLNLCASRISHKHLKQIFDLPNVNIRKLNLSGCFEISWRRIVRNDMFSNQNRITSLNLSHLTDINDDTLLYICKSLPRIEKLYIANCFALTDHGFDNIDSLQRLQTLNINNNNEITGAILTKLEKCKLVRSLMAQQVVINSEQIINKLTKFNLIQLEVGYTHADTIFSDIAVQSINKLQIHLKSLRIHSLTITNEAFIGDKCEKFNSSTIELSFLNKLIHNLEEFNLGENIDDFKNSFPVVINKCDTSISNLTKLKVLNLANCLNLSDDIFKYSMDLPRLRQLNLNYTKVTVVGICYMVQKCPNIENLDLECTNICDSAINIIAQGLTKLLYLNLKNCSQLTELSYKIIAKHCKRLQTLQGWKDLDQDETNNFDKIITALYNLPNMTNLHVSKGKIIQDEFISLMPYGNNTLYNNERYYHFLQL